MVSGNIKTEFRKVLTGYGFYLCIAFTTILCFSAEIYQDGAANDRYSVIRSFMTFDRNFLLSDTQFCSLEVMRKGSWGWIQLFIPIVSAFAFVPLKCDEHEAKVVRYEVFRSSRMKYHLSEIIAGCISGGLAVTAGYGIYAALVYKMFPDISDYSADLAEMYREGMSSYINPSTGYPGAALVKLGCVFLYGATISAVVIMLSGLIRNKYLVLCIPFFIKYAMNQTCQKVSSQIYEKTGNGETPDQRLSEIISVIYPDALSQLNEYGVLKKYVLIYSAFILAVSFVLYLIFTMTRVDSGE